MYENIHQLAESISSSAKKLIKIPFKTVVFLIENNNILQVSQEEDGELVIKVKPKALGFLPLKTELEIRINPNDYVNYEEIKNALSKFIKLK